MKYQLQNGWTKDTIIERIREKNGFVQCKNEMGTTCLYRNSLGKACFAGAFIDDDVYNPRIETSLACPNDATFAFGNAASTTMEALIDQGKILYPLSGEGMNALQRFHDVDAERFSSSEEFEQKTREWLDKNVIEVSA